MTTPSTSAAFSRQIVSVNSDADLNHCDEPTYHYYSKGSLTAVNAPVAVNRWFLEPMIQGDGPADMQGGYQRFICDQGIYIRTMTYGEAGVYPTHSFGPWVKITSFTGFVEKVNSATGMVTISLQTSGS